MLNQNLRLHLVPVDISTNLIHSISRYGGYFLRQHYSPIVSLGDTNQALCITDGSELKFDDLALDLRGTTPTIINCLSNNFDFEKNRYDTKIRRIIGTNTRLLTPNFCISDGDVGYVAKFLNDNDILPDIFLLETDLEKGTYKTDEYNELKITWNKVVIQAEINPEEIIRNMVKYCEDKQIYDKLGNYNDFYYKAKEYLKQLESKK